MGLSIYTVIFYTISFLSIYVQVFFLVTFLEKKKHLKYSPPDLKLKYYPEVTIAIPCYNEEKTIDKTILSLLELNYPKDKLFIFAIDDGSTDNTWAKIKEFEKYPNVKVFQKKNGGKHTALNLALLHTTSEFFGCLDSDSFVHKESLKRIMKYFESDKETMAVAPSIIVYHPKNILQTAQKVEYDMSVYIKKMLGFAGGIHVTPGPFSIFRKKVFDDLGNYRKAHNTEDQEIALRMQENNYKIDHCPDAYVYTIAPESILKLYRQRQRWIYGFIKNLIDYRRLLFKKKYGTVALFTLPSGLISILGFLFLFGTLLYNLVVFIYHKIIQIQTVGVHFGGGFNFDWFFLPTKTILFLSIILYILVLTSITIGRKMVKEKNGFSFTVLYFIIVYNLIAPFWLLRAIYNVIRSKEASWAFERRASKNQLL